jgi:hypothetical protein
VAMEKLEMDSDGRRRPGPVLYAGEEGCGAERADFRGQLGHDAGVADVDHPGGGHGGRGDGTTKCPSPRRGAGGALRQRGGGGRSSF